MEPIDFLPGGAEAFRLEMGRPRVTLAYAQSLDGSIAARTGRGLAISGVESLKLTHALRSCHDAILAGIGTILSDNPRLTVRLVEGGQPQPVILDSRLRLPLGANILQHPKPPWLFIKDPFENLDKYYALQRMGVRLFQLPAGVDGKLPLVEALKVLGQEGINSLMVEGGAQVLSSFLAARLVDWVVLTIAPAFIGGIHACQHLLSGAKPGSSIEEFPRLEVKGSAWAGNDWVVWGEVR